MNNSSIGSDTNSADPTRVGSEFNLDDLLGILDRMKWIILGITGAITLVAAVIVSLLPNQYTVFNVIDPGKGREKTSSLIMQGFESPETAKEIVAALGLQQALNCSDETDAVRALRAMTTISRDKRNNLLRISVTHSDASLAVQIADEYFAYIAKQATTRLWTSESIELLELEKRLQQSRETLASLENKTNTFTHPVPEDINFLAMLIGDIRAEIALGNPSDSSQSSSLLVGQESVVKMVNALNTAIRLTAKKNNLAGEALSANRAQQYEYASNRINAEFHRSLIRKLEFQADLIRKLNEFSIHHVVPPAIPLGPSGPGRARILALVFVMSLILAILLAFMIDRRRVARL